MPDSDRTSRRGPGALDSIPRVYTSASGRLLKAPGPTSDLWRPRLRHNCSSCPLPSRRPGVLGRQSGPSHDAGASLVGTLGRTRARADAGSGAPPLPPPAQSRTKAALPL
eukprot:7372403-Pyramimonas_sp.AAC.1